MYVVRFTSTQSVQDEEERHFMNKLKILEYMLYNVNKFLKAVTGYKY